MAKNNTKIKEFTISVFSENKTGLLSRIVGVFTRRKINIESLNTSESSMPGIFRFTIVVNVTHHKVEHLVKQLEKQIDVMKAFYYLSDEIVYQEIALYKVPTKMIMEDKKIEQLIRKHNARILDIEPEYTVIEKTGHSNETNDLLRDLEKYEVYEFVRSGRVAIVRPMEQLNKYLSSLEEEISN